MNFNFRTGHNNTILDWKKKKKKKKKKETLHDFQTNFYFHS
jgi:hypothetical protein